MNRLQGKVAMITGAASGMGEAAARLFAQEGARVVAGDVTVDNLNKVVADIVAAGGDATAVTLDVSKPEAWADAVATAIDKYGKIDILVNNAGIHTGVGLLECDMNNWLKVMSINAMGVWLGMKAVIPHMQANGGGSIVNTSSIAGLIGGADADAGDVAYSASKGAVRSMTKHAAQFFGKDEIRVNSVHPGPIFTGMARAAGFNSREEMGAQFGQTVLKPYIGEPLDIAYAYLYLASDESKFVTGEELVVDGGQVTH
ncbi:MAG: SDR family oxidoreductase [Propionibacteriaceae bacterium]|nr:SDR family oxidoreductase [Propionibacteriaceae bacterium]